MWRRLCLLFLLLFLLLPTLLSTPYGTRAACFFIRSCSSYNLEIQKVRLSWWGRQTLSQATLRKNGELLLSFKEFSTQTSLLSLLLRRELNDTKLIDPQLVIKKSPPHSAEKSPHRNHARSRLSFKHLWVERGVLRFVGEGGEVTFTDLQIDAKREEKSLSLICSGHSLEEGLSGNFYIEAEADDLSTPFLEHYPALQEGQRLVIHSSFLHFPLDGVDRLVSWYSPKHGGLLTAYLGKTLNQQVEVDWTSTGGACHATLVTPLLQASCRLSFSPKGVVLEEPATLSWTATPFLFQRLFGEEEWQLVNDLKSQVTLTQFSWEPGMLLFHAEGHILRGDFLYQGETPVSIKETFARFEGTYGESGLDASLSLSSPWMTIEELPFTLATEGLRLKSPATVSVTLTPMLASILSLPPLQKEVSMNFFLQRLEVPRLSSFPFFDLSETTLEGEMAADLILLSGEQPLAIDNFKLSIPKSPLSSAHLLIEADLSQRELLQLAGSKVHALLSLNLSTEECRITLEGARLRTSLLGELRKGSFALTEQSTLSIKLEHPLFEATRATFLLHEFRMPLRLDQLDRMVLKADGKIETWVAKNGIHLNNLLLRLQVEGPKNRAHAQLQGEIEKRVLEKRGFFSGEATFEHFLVGGKWSRGEILSQISLKGEGLPTGILNDWVEAPLSSFLGPELALLCEGEGIDGEGALTCKLTGQGFRATLTAHIDREGSIALEEPARLVWQLTPERYELLHRMPPEFLLQKPAWITLDITHLDLPALSSFSQFLKRGGAIADLSAENLFLTHKRTKETVIFEGWHASIDGQSFADKIDVVAAGDLFVREESSSINLTLSLQDLWTTKWRLNREQLSAKIALTADNVPIGPLSGVLPLSERTRRDLFALFGATLNARISAELRKMAGPIDIDIVSHVFSAKVPAYLSSGVLTLRDDVEARLVLTQELSESFLKEINPLLLTAVESPNPVILKMSAEGFSFPVRPFDWKRAQVGHGVLDLGKIRVRNGGTLLSLLDLVQAKEVSSEGETEAWFTPIYWRLEEGVATYERFDALIAGNVHIASWGTIDLSDDKVKMILGISPSTLHRVFGITGLREDYLFQLKMRGTTSDVSIDWKTAKTRIGILIAKSAGKKGGILINGLIGIISAFIGEEKTPPPTTTPFPWGKESSDI